MAFSATSLAATTNSSVRNTQFQPSAANLDRKMLIIGSYDPAKTDIVDNVPALILGPSDAGATYGFGSMIHRLAIAAFKGTKGLPMYVVPQPEAGGAAAATGDVTFAIATIEAGTLHLYIAGDHVPVALTDGMTVENITDACVAAINANQNLLVTAAKRAVTFELDLTAKTQGTYGNEVSIKFNLGAGQEFPTGLTSAVVTAMSGGTGTPVITNALNGLGTGDSSNEDWYTDVVHGYLQDSTTLNAIETYGGSGNTFTGLYLQTVGRPFRVFTGDVATGSAGLTALIAVSDLRKLDRVNGVIAVPGSPNHPSEIAAQAMGHMARINQTRAAQHYVDVVLEGVWRGALADDWTTDYDNRDLAVKSGISTTQVKNGVVTMQNMVTFYRPDNVPESSNGYRAMSNICKIQNIINAFQLAYSSEEWKGNFIVADKSIVTGIDKEKARDITDVIAQNFAIVTKLAENGWIYSDTFTKEELKKSGAVAIRTGGTGFDNSIKVILSGEGGIINTVIDFDISLAVFGQ